MLPVILSGRMHARTDGQQYNDVVQISYMSTNAYYANVLLLKTLMYIYFATHEEEAFQLAKKSCQLLADTSGMPFY